MANPQLHRFCGIHLVGELYGIDPLLLNDLSLLEKTMLRGIEASGASLCGKQTKSFTPAGITILALLSESHTSIHTYPEHGALFFDAFTCGTECRPEMIAKCLIEDLKPIQNVVYCFMRGSSETLDRDLGIPGCQILSLNGPSLCANSYNKIVTPYLTRD